MRTWLVSLATVVLFAPGATAQTVNGNLEGRILDSAGAPVVGANVSVSSVNLIGTRGNVTDENGAFRILAIPSGMYTVLVGHVSYQSVTITEVRVPLGATATIEDVRLNLRSLEAGEVVSSSERPAIDVASTSLGQNLTNRELEGLPVERNYQAVSILLPQANESFYGDGISIAGATGIENKYYVNGIDVTDPFTGLTSTKLPYNFVREIQMRTAAYDAEYKGALGGAVNVATYTGGESLHGQVFGFFTNNNFVGEQRVGKEPPKGSFTQYDVGASVGGPIIPEKLWFFGAYNPSVAKEDVAIYGLGNYEDSKTTHMFAGKFSWRIDERNDIQFTCFGDPAFGRSVTNLQAMGLYQALNSDPFLYTLHAGSVNALISGTHVLGGNVLLETSASWMTVINKLQPETEKGQSEVIFYDNVNNQVSGGANFATDEASTQLSLGAKVTATIGNHTLRAGLEYVYLKHTFDSWGGVYHRDSDTVYVGQMDRYLGTVGTHQPGIFVQDSWQMSSHFRFNFGVRWDPQYMISSEGKVAQKLLSQYSPRFGVIYLPTGNETEKISLSVGRFYQSVAMYLQKWYQSSGNSSWYKTWNHDPRVDQSGATTLWDYSGFIASEVPGMKGQYYDEVTIAYERAAFHQIKIGLRGTYRTLREGVQDGIIDANLNSAFGNPGSPPMQNFPKMKRDYAALEVTVNRSGPDNFNWMVAYVLSRTYGNSPGLYDVVWKNARPNTAPNFEFPEFLTNATGLLPYDRTHVFKFIGSYTFEFGLTAGALFIWESGVPLSEYGGTGAPFYVPLKFLAQRGTNGRSPSLWDLNIRLTFDLAQVIELPARTRVLLDAFHVGSPRRAVNYDQTHYFDQDANGNQINPNPEYMQPTQFQPPMSVRLGMEVNF